MDRGTKIKPLTIHYLIAELAADNDENPYSKVMYSSSALQMSREERAKIGLYPKGLYAIYQDKLLQFQDMRAIKGGIMCLEIVSASFADKNEQTLYPLDTEFDEIFHVRLMPLHIFEIGNRVKKVKEGIKECLGGGWSQNIDLYEYKDVYYAPYECSSYMNSVYLEDSGLLDYKNELLKIKIKN